jgi:hypothetical protein
MQARSTTPWTGFAAAEAARAQGALTKGSTTPLGVLLRGEAQYFSLLGRPRGVGTHPSRAQGLPIPTRRPFNLSSGRLPPMPRFPRSGQLQKKKSHLDSLSPLVGKNARWIAPVRVTSSMARTATSASSP